MPDTIAMLYADDAYVELLADPTQAAKRNYAGLMGRRVAGRGFLEALLSHSRVRELVAVVFDAASARSFDEMVRTHPVFRSGGKRGRGVPQVRFHQHFLSRPTAPVLFMSQPLDARFAWARHHRAPGSFAITGVTHTICSAAVVGMLCQMVTAPFEPYDVLVCTSQAARAMVERLTDNFAEHLRELHGGQPRRRGRLEVIPLGVDVERYRPATPAERTARRQAIGITNEEVAFLFVGRMSFHAKASPFPAYRALAEAVRRTGARAHLVLSGEPPNDAIRNAFLQGARDLAPGVRVTHFPSSQGEWRTGIWHAADVFLSLADNLQETFGLSVIEAQASGLPVVVSDWDGYRDLVVEGVTGYRVPTLLVRDATADLTSRFLLDEMNYDYFIAEAAQAAVVDTAATTEVVTRLLADAALRQQLGQAARKHAVEHFAWPQIIAAYDRLWDSQERERLAASPGGLARDKSPRAARPACYPPPEFTFASWPTRILEETGLVQATPDAPDRLEQLLTLPLTSFLAETRCTQAAVLQAVLSVAATPCPLTQLDRIFEQADVPHVAGRATLAWLLKYDLLRRLPDPNAR
jgi:glycosyltransferase involved in cell wall biosynthesis